MINIVNWLNFVAFHLGIYIKKLTRTHKNISSLWLIKIAKSFKMILIQQYIQCYRSFINGRPSPVDWQMTNGYSCQIISRTQTKQNKTKHILLWFLSPVLIIAIFFVCVGFIRFILGSSWSSSTHQPCKWRMI